jgi:hypothetical protein
MYTIRLILLLAICTIFPNIVQGQHTNKWKKANLSFETKGKIKKYFSLDRRIYDADNDSLGINMELVKYKNESNDFINDIDYGCKEICEDMKMTFQTNGSSFIQGHRSYYVVCFDDEPVITAVILRDDLQKAYEISLYCYKIDIDEGVRILETIKFKR